MAENWAAFGRAGHYRFVSDQGELYERTATKGNYITRLACQVVSDSVSLVFGNYAGSGEGGSFGTTTPLTVRAVLEFWPFGNGYRDTATQAPIQLRLLRNGSPSWTIQPGEQIQTDPATLPYRFRPGMSFLVRTYVEGAAGKIPLNMSAVGKDVSDTTTDKTMVNDPLTVPTATEFAYGPCAVVGYGPTAKAKVVAIIGDSIAEQGNYPFRNLDVGVPYLDCARGGDALFRWLDHSNDPRSALIARATDVIELLGANDFGNSAGTAWTTVANRKLQAATPWKAAGKRVWIHTLPPTYVTTTDNWATEANQTPGPASPARVTYNNWTRGGAPIDPATKLAVPVGTAGALTYGQAGHPHAGYFEVADLIESARDSGRWMPSSSLPGGGRPTSDGLHLDAGGAEQLGFATSPINPAVFYS